MTKKNNINLKLSWDKDVIPAKIKTERSLLIELQANNSSKIEKKERQAVNLALVIDRSGSMQGSPIEAAKSAAIQIAEKLNSQDRLSIVTFDSEIDTLFSNVQMNEQGSSYAKALIREVYARGSTNLSGGWFEGAKCVTKAIDEGTFKNGFVMVLSDGMANQGIENPNELHMHASELASRGIQTSSIGIGAHYSPLQLDALAEGGRGRLHHTETDDDIIDVVLGELGEIGNTVAKNIKLNIHHPESVELKCLSKMKFIRSGNYFQINVGNLQLGQIKSIALLSSINKYTEGSEVTFESHITWEDIETGEVHESAVTTSTLKVVSVDESERVSIDNEVVKKVADIWEASIAYESIIFNEQNQFERASSLYDDNSIAFGYMVDSLEDSNARINRFNSAQKKVSKIWQGRSKRDAYSSIKKCVMSEPDLRQGDSGRWHDEL